MAGDVTRLRAARDPAPPAIRILVWLLLTFAAAALALMGAERFGG